MTFDSFKNILDDERVSEIIIVDDASEPQYFERLRLLCEGHEDKIRLYRNDENLDCYANKRKAISKATNDYVILADSDNTFRKDYIDKLYECDWVSGMILMPDFGRPHFNYSSFSGKMIDRLSVKNYLPTMSSTRFDCLINAANYFVNKDEYLRLWDGSINPHTADTIFMNYNWLKAGNSIYVVPGMQYDHLIHNQSHYILNVRKTGNLFNEICQKMMEL